MKMIANDRKPSAINNQKHTDSISIENRRKSYIQTNTDLSDTFNIGHTLTYLDLTMKMHIKTMQ